MFKTTSMLNSSHFQKLRREFIQKTEAFLNTHLPRRNARIHRQPLDLSRGYRVQINQESEGVQSLDVFDSNLIGPMTHDFDTSRDNS